MALIFQVRGSQLDAWYAKGIPDHSARVQPGGTAALVANVAGGFGGKAIDFRTGGNYSALVFNGPDNLPIGGPITLLFRIIPTWTGTTVSNGGQALGCASDGSGGWLNGWAIGINGTGLIQVLFRDKNFNNSINNITTTTAPAWVSGTAIDIMISWDGTTGANAFKISVNGVLFQTFTATGAIAARDRVLCSQIILGWTNNLGTCNAVNYYLDEFCIWDDAENPVYATRSTYMSASNTSGTIYTDPGASNVKSGISYTFAGIAKTGSLASTDPGISNVKVGVGYTINGASLTGTYDGSDRWSDPGPSNVYLGLNYLANGVSKTGLLDEPNPSVVKAGTVYYEGQRTGAYTGADRWSDPGAANVSAGVTYLANSVQQTGTKLVVTNVLTAATLNGGTWSATLEAE